MFRQKGVTLRIPYALAVLLGIAVWAFPRAMVGNDARRFAAVLIVLGVLSIALRDRQFRPVFRRACLLDGISFLIAGIAIFARYRSILNVLPTIIGLLLIIQGTMSVLVCHYCGQMGERKWLFYALLFFAVIGLGGYMLVTYFFKSDPVIRTTGFSILVNGLAKLALFRVPALMTGTRKPPKAAS